MGVKKAGGCNTAGFVFGNILLMVTFTPVKIICLLLSFYVLVLAARPCCSDNNCLAKSTSQNELASKSTSQEKGCKGDCSPFFSCGTCSGFIVSRSFLIKLPSAESPVKAYTAYQHPYIKEISLAIWQPPQLG